MATLKDARRQRRNARDRINYQFRKYGLPMKFTDVSDMLPGVSKHMTPEKLDDLVDVYKSWNAGRIKAYVQTVQDFLKESAEAYDEEFPEPFSNIEAYSDLLNGLETRLGSQFDRMIDYLINFTAFTELEIEDLLGGNPEYFETIKKYYEIYEDDERGSNSKFYGSLRVLNKLAREVFHIFVEDLKEW